eukprot:tig00000829_g4663.t1
MRLYTYPGNNRAAKALIAAKYAGVAIEVPAFNFGADNQSADFKAKNPLGKVPVLETPAGCIFESNAIARYVARLRPDAELYGTSFFESGQVDQWLDYAMNELELPVGQLTYPLMGYMVANKAATDKAKADLLKQLDILDHYLVSRTYFVGEKITLADISLACTLVHAFRLAIDAQLQAKYVNVTRWFTTCINQPEFKAVLGEVKLGDKAADGAAPAAKKEEKKKEEKPKEEKKPKKKEEEDDGEEDYGDEDGEKGKSKAPHPCDLLPKSSLVFDDWKRMYSNNDTRAVALPWLWQHLDKEGYSFYKADYMYPEENNKLFMTCNLVSGWLQRIEKLRKYGFGNVLILGDEPKLNISAIWMFRGQVPPPEMANCDDYTNYTWEKLNVDNEAHKKMIEDYFAWDGESIKGKNFREGKVFK